MTEEISLQWNAEGLEPFDSFNIRYTYSSNRSDTDPIPVNTDPDNTLYAHPITELVPGDQVTITLETVNGDQVVAVDTVVQRTRKCSSISFISKSFEIPYL